MANCEVINDLKKLLVHRLVARALVTSPQNLDEARDQVQKWKDEDWIYTFVREWDEILSRPVEKIRRDIIRRDQNMRRLRNSSPFYLTPTMRMSEEVRRRQYRVARRIAEKYIGESLSSFYDRHPRKDRQA